MIAEPEKEVSKSRRMCWDKVRYESDFKAAYASGVISFKLNRKLRWYQCPLCDGWHHSTAKQ